MSDDGDFAALFTGLTNTVPSAELSLADVLAMNEKIAGWRDREPPYPTKIELTEADYASLLAPHGFASHPNEFGVYSVAVVFGVPVFYAEQSAVYFSDGTKRLL